MIATVGVDDRRPGLQHQRRHRRRRDRARRCGAEKLVYLTDVAGLYADYPDESSLISRIDVAGLDAMLADRHAPTAG